VQGALDIAQSNWEASFTIPAEIMNAG